VWTIGDLLDATLALEPEPADPDQAEFHGN
jgi:hypothetical protein